MNAAQSSSASRVQGQGVSKAPRVLTGPSSNGASVRESSCEPRDCRAVEARAHPSRRCPTGSASALAGRGSSVQTEPGCRTAGVGTPSTFATWGTRRKRAVSYWMATLPLPVRQGEPSGATHGGHQAGVRFHALEAVVHGPDRFVGSFQTSSRLRQLMKHDRRRRTTGRCGVSWAVTHETPFRAAPSPVHDQSRRRFLYRDSHPSLCPGYSFGAPSLWLVFRRRRLPCSSRRFPCCRRRRCRWRRWHRPRPRCRRSSRPCHCRPRSPGPPRRPRR